MNTTLKYSEKTKQKNLKNILKNRDIQIRKEKLFSNTLDGGGSRGVIVKALDCGIIVREVELQLRHYFHFQTYTIGKGMGLLILPAVGWIASLLF